MPKKAAEWPLVGRTDPEAKSAKLRHGRSPRMFGSTVPPPSPDAAHTFVAEAIGTRLRAVRLDAGVTSRALAHALGVAENTLQQWEAGRQVPKLYQLVRYAKALGLSPLTILEALE